MINTFARIDHLASAGRSPWHRASGIAKLLLVSGFVALAVFTPSGAMLLVLLATALALALTARMPPRLVAAAAFTPVLFAALFALARWSGGPRAVLVVFVRPVIASLMALWLVGTTPYPDLFAPISQVLPRSVGDSLFLTYRAVFVLLSRLERLWNALRLRGGLAGPLPRRTGMVGEAVGTVVLSGFERSQRLYHTMLLRGHSGRICGCRHYLERGPGDPWVIAVSVWTAVAGALVWRLRLP